MDFQQLQELLKLKQAQGNQQPQAMLQQTPQLPGTPQAQAGIQNSFNNAGSDQMAKLKAMFGMGQQAPQDADAAKKAQDAANMAALQRLQGQ